MQETFMPLIRHLTKTVISADKEISKHQIKKGIQLKTTGFPFFMTFYLPQNNLLSPANSLSFYNKQSIHAGNEDVYTRQQPDNRLPDVV